MFKYTIIGVIVFLMFYIIYLYNKIIRRKNEVSNAFSSVDVMLKRRYDLLPKLIEIVKEYVKYESILLKEITEIRVKLSDNISENQKIDLHNKLYKNLNSLMISFENYPILKANQNFLKLQGSWTETEEQIAAARRYFNSTVTYYNIAIQTFPANIIAQLFNYSEMKVFELRALDRNVLPA